MAKHAPAQTEAFDVSVKKQTGLSTGMALALLAVGSGAAWAAIAWLAYTIFSH